MILNSLVLDYILYSFYIISYTIFQVPYRLSVPFGLEKTVKWWVLCSNTCEGCCFPIPVESLKGPFNFPTLRVVSSRDFQLGNCWIFMATWANWYPKFPFRYPHPSQHFWVDDFSISCLVEYVGFLKGTWNLIHTQSLLRMVLTSMCKMVSCW